MMPDKKERLERDLEEFERRRDDLLRDFSMWVGRLQRRTAGNPVGRWFLRNVTTRLAAWAIVRFRFLTIEKPESGSMVDVAYQWQKLALFMRVPVEIESAEDDRVVLIHNQCSVGFKPGEEEVCRASMNMDHEILRRMGCKLTTTETISAGGARCRHIIEPLD